MWIKICANTNLEDAQLAGQLGASAVGFVFASSPRQITPEHARAISRKLPGELERVGVFEIQDPKEIIKIVETADLSGIQLHGNLDLDLVRRLKDHFADRISLIQVLHWRLLPDVLAPLDALEDQLRLIRREHIVSRILIDSQIGAIKGGTGVSFDWETASGLRAKLGDLKLIVAGGLRPDNVEAAIRTLSPWGVDVVSGVELSPGRKDPKRLEAFISKGLLLSSRDRA